MSKEYKKSNIEIINSMIEKLENRHKELIKQYEIINSKDFSNVNIRYLQMEKQENNKKAMDKLEIMTYISGKIDTLKLVREMLIANNKDWTIESQYRNMVSNLIHSV